MLQIPADLHSSSDSWFSIQDLELQKSNGENKTTRLGCI